MMPAYLIMSRTCIGRNWLNIAARVHTGRSSKSCRLRLARSSWAVGHRPVTSSSLFNIFLSASPRCSSTAALGLSGTCPAHVSERTESRTLCCQTYILVAVGNRCRSETFPAHTVDQAFLLLPSVLIDDDGFNRCRVRFVAAGYLSSLQMRYAMFSTYL